MIKAQKPSFLLLFAIFGCILLAGAQFLRESQSAEFSGRRPDRLKTYGYSRDCRRLGTPDSDRFIEVCRQGLGDGVALEIRYLGELSRQRKWPLPISAMLQLNGREGLFQMASIQDSFLGIEA